MRALLPLVRLGIPAIALAVLAGCAGAPAPEPLYARMAEGDVTLAATTMQAALEHASHGESRTWRNPETGNAGAVAPQRTYVSEAGWYCREYRERLAVDGQSASYANTACRQPDGSWRWVN